MVYWKFFNNILKLPRVSTSVLKFLEASRITLNMVRKCLNTTESILKIARDLY